ncbi:MAG: MtN3 and saliva related transmembrane protein [Nitrospinales bacterium]|jgi:MtN3 and saliva related transmembrane protein
MDSATMIGYFAGFLTTVSFIPQVLKTWKSKSASDLSLWMFSAFSLGVLCWLVYGVLLGEAPMIFWNVVTLIFALALLVMKLKFD